jgi:hypothetical protein
MKKKILSAILAMTMVMGLSISAFAEPLTTFSGLATGSEIDGTGAANVPVIKVTVPTALFIAVNPYEIPVSFDPDGNGEAAAVDKTDQIISAVQEIKSESQVPIAVNIDKFKAEKKAGSSDIAIVTSSAKKAKLKSAYVTITIGKNVLSTDAADKKLNKTLAAKDTDTGASLASAYIIPAGTKVGDTNAYSAQTCNFIIGGDVNANPVNASGVSDPWATTDGIKVTVKFTFTPQLLPAE